MKQPFLFVAFLFFAFVGNTQTTITPYGSLWKYLDNGTNQGTTWRGVSFNDAAWKSGAAQLGYGDGDEATVVGYGSNSKKKYITTYFRKVVSIVNPAGYSNFSLSLKRDDGAVVYINGNEVYRTNLPTGTISYTIKASVAAADDGNTPQLVTIPVSAFVNGNNTIAVEMHQVNSNDADISFDLQLIANAAVSNVPPVANAGIDQSITLPANSVSLNGSQSSDADGTITYLWSKFSGPAAGTITNGSSAIATASGLTEGTYVFRLTVTDNNSATATDDVTITVNAATVPVTSYNAIDYGTGWKYLDNGSDQGTAWRNVGFADGSWASGNAQLGYGDGDEATVISYGPNSSAKYTTSYFRKVISINSPASYTNFSLGIKRDDGVVIYVNGAEAYRNNMPTGTITSATLASAAAADDGATIQTATIASSFFVNGNNTIAVEMHQNAGTSTDLSFDMELRANAPGGITLTRGPYLQMANGNAVSLRWRSDIATDSKISVGTVNGVYTITATNATVTTEHEVRVTGLSPDTKYFYSFGSSTQKLQAAAANFFTTAPPLSATRKIRIAAYGDCGTNTNGFQAGALAAYQNYVGASPAEIMLLLGDNAYDAGTDLEYTSNFFNAYNGNILKNHVVFPAPGNHDYANNGTRQNDHNVPYYNIFTMPTAGECGGVASGTEAFYSYNWGNIHFLSLDSYGKENSATRLYDTLGAQVTWIKNDLAANTSKWTIAYWHHPPYTMGSHNSDTESELINMRQNFIRILERNGVDLVLCGHSHDYERSYLLKGHFGNEASFSTATHAVSSSNGYYDGSSNSCPYNTASGKVNHGTVYVVAGSAGADGGVQGGYPHNALPFSVDDGGMLYFEVENNRLDAKFIRRDGVIADKFTILKDAGRSTSVSINSGETVTLTASWKGNYVWSTGATTESITVSPATTTSYTCSDGSSCITDNFTVNVSAALTQASLQFSEKSGTLKAYPTPVKKGEYLTITSDAGSPVKLDMFNAKGQKVKQLTIQGSTRVATSDLHAGIYYIHATKTDKKIVRKIVVTD
jgi:hypothetical protein